MSIYTLTIEGLALKRHTRQLVSTNLHTAGLLASASYYVMVAVEQVPSTKGESRVGYTTHRIPQTTTINCASRCARYCQVKSDV